MDELKFKLRGQVELDEPNETQIDLNEGLCENNMTLAGIN